MEKQSGREIQNELTELTRLGFAASSRGFAASMHSVGAFQIEMHSVGAFYLIVLKRGEDMFCKWLILVGGVFQIEMHSVGAFQIELQSVCALY